GGRLLAGAVGLVAEVAVDEGVGEAARDPLPGDEDAVVDRAGQLVDGQVDVRARAELPAGRRPPEGLAVVVALGGDELGREPGRDGRVGLLLAGQRPYHRPRGLLAQERKY